MIIPDTGAALAPAHGHEALHRRLEDLEHRAAESANVSEARALLEEASRIRYRAQRAEPAGHP
ncbi:hypothetical protein [Streptomyces sp. NPDC090994]|uniref:hypothetical protein n=1 Tax=Streptomyces sp. NPDC090994 TaxID=3365969 RepID=UPI00382CEC69